MWASKPQYFHKVYWQTIIKFHQESCGSFGVAPFCSVNDIACCHKMSKWHLGMYKHVYNIKRCKAAHCRSQPRVMLCMYPRQS